MAKFDTADLLFRCKVALNRPSSDEAFTVSATDDVWYHFLTVAQDHVFGIIAATAPDALMSELTLLTTNDDGLTYTFGTDADGDLIRPYGHYELYQTPTAYPGYPLAEGVDFVAEPTKVRGMNDQTMAAPWARFVTPPNKISSSLEPTLQPKHARILIALYATALAAEQRLKQDASSYRADFEASMRRVLLDLKTAVLGKGGAYSAGSSDAWWRTSPDLG